MSKTKTKGITQYYICAYAAHFEFCFVNINVLVQKILTEYLAEIIMDHPCVL